MHIHFIGIGGIGLSALAKFLAGFGHKISGSDIAQTEITKDLEQNYNASITIPHHPDAVNGADLVIYSAVIKPDNVEYQKAKELGIKIIPRKEALKFILKDFEVFAVAGAHGKSTTSAILASIMPDSNALIGAISKEFNSNVRTSKSKKVVFEADESDASFLNSNPHLAVVTNVEPEHMEYYEYDYDRFYQAYRDFLELADIRVLNGEDEFLSNQNDLENIYLEPSKDIKDVEYILIDKLPYTKFNLRDFGEFRVYGFGYHLAVDAALAILAALNSGEDIEAIRKNLLNYKGIKKRFDIIQNDNLIVIDDYGHHPTEIKATLKGVFDYAKALGIDRVYAIWQPHKYSRTADNLEGFVKAFEGVDELTILPIWAAGEEKREINLEEAFKEYNPIMANRVTKKDNKIYILDKEGNSIKTYNNGVVVAFGAGDITYQIRGIK
ncbi:MAG: UDP-N-acetylmuramate--L-alanine ligase [Epsilonproteobacteria bacterium]|nr:UDP-N-acetylmuramate--L-alanine ligase [Campylobacterota bacterium]